MNKRENKNKGKQKTLTNVVRDLSQLLNETDNVMRRKAIDRDGINSWTVQIVPLTCDWPLAV